MIEKLRLKNATLKTHIKKVEVQLKHKEEMGDVLHYIDFHQLQIENKQYVAKIDERNQELLQLKMTTGKTVQVLNDLKALGVMLSMDDFGTGHSSLSCLHEFPLDVLKIDRSFVMNAKHVRDYAALLQAILTLADNLELQVVAEGITDSEQLILLQALGCEYGQGYLFSEPCTTEEIQSLFGSQIDWTQNSSEMQTATT